MTGDRRPVFVYGTLTDPSRADALLDDWGFGADAVLTGCHRVVGRHPTLAPGGRTDGRLLVTPELDVLDAYEGVDAGLYVRVAVPLVGDREPTDDAWVYVGDPERLGVPGDWPGDGPFAERVRRHLDGVGATVRRVGNR